MAKKRIYGVFLGVGLTMILQSSGAVTSMLVGLGSAGMISLSQVMSVILEQRSAQRSRCRFSHSISLSLVCRYLPFFFFVNYLSRRRTLKTFAAAMMGFGMLFFGLEVILRHRDLGNMEMFQQIDSDSEGESLGERAFGGILYGCGCELSRYDLARYDLNGARFAHHAGLCLLDFWREHRHDGHGPDRGYRGNYVGRQVAWAHSFFKIASVVFFFPFAHQIADLFTTGVVERAIIANINTAYNCLAALIALPFVQTGAAFIEKLFSTSARRDAVFGSVPKEKRLGVALRDRAHAEREAFRCRTS